MVIAGVDAGIKNIKVALFQDGKPFSLEMAPVRVEPFGEMVQRAIAQAAFKGKIEPGTVQKVVATGLGASFLSYPRQSQSICLARGAHFALPSCGSALDIGAQRTMAVRVEKGQCTKFATNDKCASGSGMFLEMVAEVLRMKLEDLGALSLWANGRAEVSSTCTVFAESEIISLIHEGTPVEDVVQAAVNALVARVYPLAASVGLVQELVLCGGVAKNQAVVNALEKLVGFPIVIPEHPQFLSAFGAALLAEEEGL
jgi:(R)-2-hydroxyacyl-CoA dehydratese activating ATPase